MEIVLLLGFIRLGDASVHRQHSAIKNNVDFPTRFVFVFQCCT